MYLVFIGDDDYGYSFEFDTFMQASDFTKSVLENAIEEISITIRNKEGK